MILSEKMVDTLHEIRRIETNKISRILNVPAAELGNCMIDLYYSTSRLETRTLIADFMHQAGVVWMRKLLTRDTSPIASTQTRFATLNDYVELLAANDEQLFADQLPH